MIKSLLDADEEQPVSAPPPKEITIEDGEVNPKNNEMLAHDDDEQITLTRLPREVFEIPDNAKFFTTMPETSEVADEKVENSVEQKTPPIEEDNQFSDLLETEVIANPQTQTPNGENLYADIWNDQDLLTDQADVQNQTAETTLNQEEKNNSTAEKTVYQSTFTPETPDETIRKSGMAYSAAIVLVASVGFMMLLGWFADLLLGSSPWGVVGGIVLGSIIGFVQFFRITSSILK